MKKTLAIKGHATRGKEVIEILEMLGGVNKYEVNGSSDELYIIRENDNAIILSCPYYKFVVFTLEEFLEEYPYKVGDKVIIKRKNKEAIVDKVVWCCDTITYWLKYDDMIEGNWRVEYLQPYEEETVDESIDKTNQVIFEANAQSCDIMNDIIKEETMREKLEQITLDIPAGYEFFGINDDNKIVLTKIQQKYPKTYEECCKVLFPNSIELGKVLTSGYKCELLQNLGKLIICRDAYWKIYGEKMGLGELWKPYWNDDYQDKWIINFYRDEINLTDAQNVHFVLAFPTEEMRDAFHENFKDLIEKCKELL